MNMMKKTMSAIVFALAIAATPALARTNNPSVTIPSMRNSGVGIHGLTGTEDGPAVRLNAVGLAGVASKDNLSAAEQDAANNPALPGTEAGSAVKPPHLG